MSRSSRNGANSLRRALASLRAENGAQSEHIRRLEHLNLELLRFRYGKRPEKLAAEERQLAFEDLEARVRKWRRSPGWRSIAVARAEAASRRTQSRPSSEASGADRAGDRARERTLPLELRGDGADRRRSR